MRVVSGVPHGGAGKAAQRGGGLQSVGNGVQQHLRAGAGAVSPVVGGGVGGKRSAGTVAQHGDFLRVGAQLFCAGAHKAVGGKRVLFGGGEGDSLTDAGHASGYLADGESLAGLTGLLAGVDTADGDFQAQLYATDEAAELWIVVAAYDEAAGRYTGCWAVSGSGGELNAAGRLDALPEGSRFLALGLIEPSEGTSASSPLRVLLPAE